MAENKHVIACPSCNWPNAITGTGRCVLCGADLCISDEELDCAIDVLDAIDMAEGDE